MILFVNDIQKGNLILEKPFAINNSTKEVIFHDNTTAPFNYFKSKYLDTIRLIDISKNSIHINNYLNDHFLTLSNIFNIEEIEYVDDRRYNLILSNDTLVMLPKVSHGYRSKESIFHGLWEQDPSLEKYVKNKKP